MISIPINKSFSQISVVSSKLAPDEKDEGRNEGEKDREREKGRENGRNLSAYSGVSFLAEEKSYFSKRRDKSDLKGRFRANGDKLISQERNDERRGS